MLPVIRFFVLAYVMVPRPNALASDELYRCADGTFTNEWSGSALPMSQKELCEYRREPLTRRSSGFLR
jgi:hypothetical protein